MKKTIQVLLLLFCSFAIAQSYKVIGVKDGDTVSLLMDGKEQTVRLAYIDCPEKKQPYGTKAKELTSALCFGKMVILQGDGKRDRNGRLIAEIVLSNGVNVNKALVKSGLAWHYKTYSKDERYAQLEFEARKKKTGLWKEKNPVAPWKWRKMSKEEKSFNSLAF